MDGLLSGALGNAEPSARHQDLAVEGCTLIPSSSIDTPFARCPTPICGDPVAAGAVTGTAGDTGAGNGFCACTSETVPTAVRSAATATEAAILALVHKIVLSTDLAIIAVWPVPLPASAAELAD